jgi:amino acid adenylation domain-containing protein
VKILLVQNMTYIPESGGANKGNRLLMEMLAERGHSCRMLTLSTSAQGYKTHLQFTDELTHRGISIVSYSPGVDVFRHRGIEVHAMTDSFHLRAHLSDQIHEFEPTWILVTSEDTGQILLQTALDASLSRVVYLARSTWKLPFGPASFLTSPAGTNLLQQTAGTIAISRYVQEYIKQWAGLESVVIRLPAITLGTGPFSHFGCFDRGFVTMVNPCAVKGISIFLALAQILPDVQFAAVPTWGTTEADRADLEELPNVRMLEADDDIDEIFSRTRILLVPSLWAEAFGRIVAEAMLRGIPVLASNVGGLPEAKLGIDYILPVCPIERYETRVDDKMNPVPLVPEQNIGPWLDALRELLNNRDLYNELSKASREAAHRAYITDGTPIAPLENFLENLVPSSRVHPNKKSIKTASQDSETDDLRKYASRLSSKRRTLLVLRALTAKAQKRQLILSIRRIPRDGELPLSFAQQRLWLMDQLEPDNPVYNICQAYRIIGKLDVTALEQSLNKIVQRHETLRTVFKIIDGQPMQVISPNLDFTLHTIDFGDVPEAKQRVKAQLILDETAKSTFDLTTGPLLRATLLRLGHQEHIFFVTMHHIISDGWSMGVFFRELKQFYEAFSRNESSSLSELPVQYADFAVWQRQWLTGQTLETQLNYWRKHLGEQIHVLELPTDRPRPPVQTYKGASQSLILSKTLTEQINALTKQEGVTLFMTLLAAFKTLLHQLTGQDDVVVASPVANRNHSEIEGLIGFFVNTLVLRTDLSGDPTFLELLHQVRKIALGAYAHQDLPFEKLVEELQPERDLSRSPLFQVLFNMLNYEYDQFELQGLNVERIPISEFMSKFDLTVSAEEQNKRIKFRFVYNVDLFEETTIAFMLDHFKTLLENIVADPKQHVSEFRLLNETKWLHLTTQNNLVHLKNLFIEFKKEDIDQSISARFEQQVERHPMNVAVKMKGDEWTYKTLNETANRSANVILASCGSKEDRIGLLFEHDAQMIAGIFALLKAGKAYIPLDPSLPVKRIHQILNDSQITTLLTNNTNYDLAKSMNNNRLQIINMDDIEPNVPVDNINLPIPSDTVAYILYTSGSTGSPKGVMQTHRNVLGHIRNYSNGLHICNCDRMTLFSNYSFDAAMMDIMGALLNGATLCPIDLREKDSVRLSEWLIREKITIYHSTPTVYRYLISILNKEQKFPEVRLVVLGGEEVHKKDVEMYKKHFSPECIFVNTYGPTESTIALQYFLDHKIKITRNTVPIGYPVDNTEILLLNKMGKVTDVYGEIAIRSEHITTGYWRRSEMMHEVFLPDLDGGNIRLYRTGDMGRLLPDGNIEFRGRKDFQVKIRGFRVEPAEVESALLNHEAVRECVVATSDNGQGDNNLIAYIVCNESLSSISLRRYLKEVLPDYMIPSEFVHLDAIPLIHNGKTDYESLSVLRDSRTMNRNDYVPPVSSIEKGIAEIWQSVLGIDKVGLHDNFFDVGGHSLMVIRAISHIEKKIGIHVPFREFFNQTLRQFAASCEEKLSFSKSYYAGKQNS